MEANRKIDPSLLYYFATDAEAYTTVLSTAQINLDPTEGCTYMGFETTDDKTFSYMYDCTFAAAKEDFLAEQTTLQQKGATAWSSAVGSRLPAKDTFSITSTIVAITPFPEACKVITYFDQVEDKLVQVYPCGKDSNCRLCMPSERCSRHRDCLDARCVENRCTSIGSPSSSVKLSFAVLLVATLITLLLTRRGVDVD